MLTNSLWEAWGQKAKSPRSCVFSDGPAFSSFNHTKKRLHSNIWVPALVPMWLFVLSPTQFGVAKVLTLKLLHLYSTGQLAKGSHRCDFIWHFQGPMAWQQQRPWDTRWRRPPGQSVSSRVRPELKFQVYHILAVEPWVNNFIPPIFSSLIFHWNNNTTCFTELLQNWAQ